MFVYLARCFWVLNKKNVRFEQNSFLIFRRCAIRKTNDIIAVAEEIDFWRRIININKHKKFNNP